MALSHGNMSVSKPLVYRIRVAGTPEPDFSDYARWMTFTTEIVPGDGAVTTLLGECPDQAALLGILGTLGNLGLPLISVECLGASSAWADAQDTPRLLNEDIT